MSCWRSAWALRVCYVCVRRVEFIEKKIKTFLDVGLLGGNRKLLWVNPDCGLKTREWSQVGLTLLCAIDHPSSALSFLPQIPAI